MSPNRAIGFNGALPWHIPEDLKRFKEITIGHSIIMGRHTFESLPNGALTGRRNIVVSSTQRSIPGCEVCHSLNEALDICHNNDEKDSDIEPTSEVFVIGGASLYRAALPLADKLYITIVDNDPKQADTFFPEYDTKQWFEMKHERHNGFTFTLWIRKAYYGQ